MATQVALAEIVFRHSDTADAARWEDEGSGGAGGLWFSTVLGVEGPTSPQSVSMRYCTHY